jgi:hypothetical protein
VNTFKVEIGRLIASALAEASSIFTSGTVTRLAHLSSRWRAVTLAMVVLRSTISDEPRAIAWGLPALLSRQTRSPGVVCAVPLLLFMVGLPAFVWPWRPCFVAGPA